MSARGLKPEDRPKWILYWSKVYARNSVCHASMPPCEHRHQQCAVVWNGTCGAEVVGAYDRIEYRGMPVEIRWTLGGWQHRVNSIDERDWSWFWDSKTEAESEARKYIDLAQK